jgi:DNA-binding Xre family transcriptional regulator
MKVRQVGYEWQLRQLMASRGLFSTTDLQPLLAERGVELSATQVYRLVVQTPERLNMRVLAAVCDALECTPNDLIELAVVERQVKVSAAGRAGRVGPAVKGAGVVVRPTRVQLSTSE